MMQVYQSPWELNYPKPLVKNNNLVYNVYNIKENSVNDIEMFDVVEIVKTNSMLDGRHAKVLGTYGEESTGPLGFIIMFIGDVPGHNPAIVMTPSCLKKV